MKTEDDPTTVEFPDLSKTDPELGADSSMNPVLDALRTYAEHAKLHDPSDRDSRATYGSTVFIAETDLETLYGMFKAYIFQDIIHKGYVIALTYGDFKNATELYTRMHSSCVSSETLRGCDCDCVQQLEGAIKRIAEQGNGVLFYLLQEGRGVGYAAKARDRMLVQASRDNISTFQAYHLLGLRKDYRQYRNVGEIVQILGIRAGWIVLTNNPDKVEAMRRNGLSVIRSERLEIEPEPFNLAYLKSKAESGHILDRPLASMLHSVQTPEPVIPFKPRVLKSAQRFIYMASYFLPVRPINGEIVLSKAQAETIFPEGSLNDQPIGEGELIQDIVSLRKHRLLLRINESRLKSHLKDAPKSNLELLSQQPYWFRVHVYYDIVSGHDVVVIEHGKAEIFDVPVVRVQSESIFNRFPIKSDENKTKYKKAVQHIVRYGCGAIVQVYQDGRGAGFGAMASDMMMLDHNTSYSTRESYEKLGIEFDQRDYDGLFNVLKAHIPSNKIQMVMNSPNSLITKNEYAEAIHKHRLDVVNWIFLDNATGQF
jgi:3,4-dihydroxy 2-butanone 4-phosphate synthase/GTP cyclohydrolase II